MLELLVGKLLRKDVILPPRTFRRGQCIESHLQKLERYLKAMDIADVEGKTAILLNSLDEDIASEVLAQPLASHYGEDYEWICETLRNLHKRNDTEVSHLIFLLGLKQKTNQNAEQYANELRIEAYKRMGQADAALKEKLILEAFVRGLRDPRVATAVAVLAPNTLEAAVKLAKAEARPEERASDVRVLRSDSHSELEALRVQMSALQRQVDAILSILQQKGPQYPPRTNGQYPAGPPRRSYAQVAGTQGNQVNSRPVQQRGIPQRVPRQGEQRPGNNPIGATGRGPTQPMAPATMPRQCYHCHAEGHIARQCPERQCYKCNGYGHLSYDCGYLRQMWGESSDIDALSSGTTDAEDLEHPEEAVVAVCNTVNKSSRPVMKVKRMSAEEQLACRWSEYVKGNAARPKAPKTLISESRPETAANKPIVRGKCGGQDAKLFLDTGADANVMDSAFFQQLQAINPSLQLVASKQKIRCANGEAMTSRGQAYVDITLAGATRMAKFTVVDNLFPKVIIGMRTMKAMKLVVNPSRDCAVIGVDRIPFMSRVIPPSEYAGKVPRFAQ